LALDAVEDFAGWSLDLERDGKGAAPALAHDVAVEFGLDAEQAVLLPVGLDHGVDMESLAGRCRLEFFFVSGNHGFVLGGVFAGEHDGGGVHTVLECVKAGDGLALNGAGASRFHCVGAVRAELSFARHG
jgi:hypothetical protein